MTVNNSLVFNLNDSKYRDIMEILELHIKK